jgi:hypothetical protein
VTDLNFAHVHLLLNHLPTVGFAVALWLYFVAYASKNEPLKKTGLVMIFLFGLLSIPTYVTGNAAERILCPEGECPSDVSPFFIRTHEDAALVAFVVMELTAFFAWLGLWQIRRRPILPRWNGLLLLVLSLASFGLMALAAGEGGKIRHPEIRALVDPAAPPVEDPEYVGFARQVGAVIAGNTGVSWLFPAGEAIHFVGLCLLFSVVLIVNLRILGMAKACPFSRYINRCLWVCLVSC